MAHLAQLNIGRLVAPLDDPRLEPFVSNLDAVNALAEASPGYVWRLQTDEGDATALRPYPDPDVIVNLTVWESVESLKAFVYQGDHLAVFRRRREFFEVPSEAYVVLWWVPDGHIPSLDEAKERLDFLRRHGPSPWAFTFAPRRAGACSSNERPSTMPSPRSSSTELNADIMATHAEGNHFWSLTRGGRRRRVRGAFLVLSLDGDPVGCGAVRKLTDDEAELKRMYVRPPLAGRKIGAVLVDALEAEARAARREAACCSRQRSTSSPRCACTSVPGSRRSTATASTSAPPTATAWARL